MTSGARLLSPAHNFAVVQMEGRAFPVVVMQGDSLSILVKELRETRKLLDQWQTADLGLLLEDLLERFAEVQASYERTCAENGLKLPYVKSN